MKRTKIVATIGPASASPAILRQMIQAGMNVARMNMSHGTHAWHHKTITAARAAGKRLHHTVGILVDLQGPKIRVGELPKAGIKLVKGTTIVFTTDPKEKMRGAVPVTYSNMHRDVRKGEHILLDDGLLEAVIVKISGRRVYAKVLVGGMLTSHKGFNLPQTAMHVPSVSEKDRDDARFAVAEKADWVALSFVHTAKDVLNLRRLIGSGHSAPKIIVKIERPEALKNFDAILAATDAVMVARGDLGIEIPAEQVPIVQKTIIQKCLAAGKPVVVATQMLDSMTRNPRPTRAEVSDVANAVIDHADAVMLSGESATGKYPVLAVKTMAAIAAEAEASHFDDLPQVAHHEPETVRAAVASVAGELAERVGATAIVVATKSGDTARFIARTRPELPIYAATPTPTAAAQVALTWGALPFVVPMANTIPSLVRAMLAKLKAMKKVKKGDRIVLVAGRWRELREYALQVIEV